MYLPQLLNACTALRNREHFSTAATDHYPPRAAAYPVVLECATCAVLGGAAVGCATAAGCCSSSNSFLDGDSGRLSSGFFNRDGFSAIALQRTVTCDQTCTDR